MSLKDRDSDDQPPGLEYLFADAQVAVEPAGPLRRVADQRRLRRRIEAIGERARDPQDSLSAWWAADWIEKLEEP